MSDRTVADFIEWAVRRERDKGRPPSISNLKAQELAYLAESLYGYRSGDNLADTSFQAWNHGPVLPSLYSALKGNGKEPLSPHTERLTIGPDLETIYGIVWDDFGDMTASNLRNFTHRIGPYSSYYTEGRRGIIIPFKDIHSAWRDFIDAVEQRERKKNGVDTTFPDLLILAPVAAEEGWCFDNDEARRLLALSREY
ncbi:DUF4065 domain-containing protein [Corynebacterium glucuronolyticum]|uniref:Panacea domain-containing protein n=1 Tax=Corynebacterium glucuronolyticum TaxID=39791 RepID=UPI00191CA325|nr:type II toxin-antitoxin system antitoxin SocA domain-containing protein [Corynebacterium glucuronolyticum]QQU88418.1 DUF4065 domain-containing protein [Corynebacterium glucuronolyticum]